MFFLLLYCVLCNCTGSGTLALAITAFIYYVSMKHCYMVVYDNTMLDKTLNVRTSLKCQYVAQKVIC